MRGSPSKTPVLSFSSRKKFVSDFDSLFSIRSEEDDQLIRSVEEEENLYHILWLCEVASSVWVRFV